MKTYGIDVNALTREKRTGTERYVFELIQEMMKLPLNDERVVLYASKAIPDLGKLPEGWELKILSFPAWMKGWTHLRLSYELWKSSPDVFFTPAHEVPLITGAAKVVTTIHDLAFFHIPEAYNFRSRLRHRWALTRAVKKSDQIITVSEVSKNDLIHYKQSLDARISVIHLGVANKQGETVKENQAKNPYLLLIGRLEKKKGTDILLQAFEGYCEEGGTYDLVLAGGYGFESEEIRQMLHASKWKSRIHVKGYVSEEEKEQLLKETELFVFPSRYEGFGLPLLEAMQTETPVLCSDLPVLREVGGDAAAYVDAQNSGTLQHAITQLLEDNESREEMVRKGKQRVQGFSWSSTATKTIEVLRSL